VGVVFIDDLMSFRVGRIGRTGVVVASILDLAPARLMYFHTPFKAAVILITLI
jgi:hypothetical protein